MHKNILLILFLRIIISQELASIPEIIDKGIGNNKSYIVSLTMRLGKNASISQSSEKAFNEAAQTLLKRKNSLQIESSTLLQIQDNGKFFNKIISVQVDGEINDSKTFPSKMYFKDNEIYIDYKFEFWINKNKKTKKDLYFNIDASFNEIKEYYHGDKMELSLESDSDCYMYLYNYLPYENKIVPLYGFYGKKYLKKKKLKPLSLKAEFSNKCSDEIKIFEHIILVAIKKEKDILFGKKEVTYEEFQKILKKLPRKDYETKMVSYVIHEK